MLVIVSTTFKILWRAFQIIKGAAKKGQLPTYDLYKDAVDRRLNSLQ